jgi:hypothetical protein
MSKTQRVTVHFSGSITYDAALTDYEGEPWPLNGQTHGQAMAGLIKDTILSDLMYEPGSLEEGDYVQGICDVTVTPNETA